MLRGLEQSQAARFGSRAEVAGSAGEATAGVMLPRIGNIRAKQFRSLPNQPFAVFFGGKVRDVGGCRCGGSRARSQRKCRRDRHRPYSAAGEYDGGHASAFRMGFATTHKTVIRVLPLSPTFCGN